MAWNTIDIRCIDTGTGQLVHGSIGELRWQLWQQHHEENKSDIQWELYSKSLDAGFCYIEGIEVYYENAFGQTYTVYSDWYSKEQVYGDTLQQLQNGTFTVKHLNDGTCDIKLGAKYYIHGLGDTVMKLCQGENAISLPIIDRAIKINTASDFTDEDYPVITYHTPYQYTPFLTAFLSFDGTNPIQGIATRYPSYEEMSCTFYLTDAEVNILRTQVADKKSAPIYFVLGTNIGGQQFYDVVERTLTIVNAEPVISGVSIFDVLHTDITGSGDIIIMNDNMVEYRFIATASKSATVVSTSIECGSKKVTDMTQGIFQDVGSGTFVITVTDSRGFVARKTVTKQTIDYLKPTCYQKVNMSLSGETDANVNLTISGNFFNNTFGGAANTLKLEVRYSIAGGSMGDWIDLTAQGYTPAFNNNTYSLAVTLTGFSYDTSYVFQCRATDVLNFVQSAQYTARLLPIFDWDDKDFNFNVQVKMNNQTVLRHNKDAKNTVLSGSGGNIYLRPNGSEDTEGEVQIKSDGTVVFNNGISFGSGTSDFVVDCGTASMGSNGTWRWAKWNSGKAECYGSRNFGAMAVTTAWGNLYRSTALSQALPQNLFTDTPESINIYLKDSNYGGWIAKHENTEPSESETGSFIVVRPASATLSMSHIGFHIIGKWK